MGVWGSPVWRSGVIAHWKFWNLTAQICSFFPRFEDIWLLHITQSSKVNCTLCVRSPGLTQAPCTSVMKLVNAMVCCEDIRRRCTRRQCTVTWKCLVCLSMLVHHLTSPTLRWMLLHLLLCGAVVSLLFAVFCGP